MESSNLEPEHLVRGSNDLTDAAGAVETRDFSAEFDAVIAAARAAGVVRFCADGVAVLCRRGTGEAFRAVGVAGPFGNAWLIGAQPWSMSKNDRIGDRGKVRNRKKS